MNITQCPYIKIPATTTDDKVTFADFSLVPTVYAQESADMSISESLDQQLTVPFYLLIGSIFIFVILMSVIYMYHWSKFNLGDNFIKSFLPVYFFGLLLLSIPLIFNLLF